MTPLTFIQKFLVKEPTRMWTQHTPPLHVFHSCFISAMGDIQILLLLFISFFFHFYVASVGSATSRFFRSEEKPVRGKFDKVRSLCRVEIRSWKYETQQRITLTQ